jgi:hypothetical protein
MFSQWSNWGTNHLCLTLKESYKSSFKGRAKTLQLFLLWGSTQKTACAAVFSNAACWGMWKYRMRQQRLT